MTTEVPFKMDGFFSMRYDEARRAAKHWRSIGEYNWAKDWDRYAAQLYACAEKYQRQMDAVKYNRSRGMKVVEPRLEMPEYPSCVSRREENGELVQVQLGRTTYKRPAMYQSASVNCHLPGLGKRVLTD